MQTISYSQLVPLVAAIFERAGAPPDHARIVANHLVEANLLGHDSHGVLRVPQYCLAIESGELVPDARPTLVRECLAGAVMDGGHGFGQVATMEAMTLVLAKARRTGIAAVALRNCYHSGRLGAYTTFAAEAGMVGLVMLNGGGGGQSVAPFGGTQRRLATNPFSIAVPSCGEFPLVLDISTSVAPEGKVRDHALRGVDLPEGWVVDAKGRPSCNPKDFYGPPVGALLPFGGPAGYKGFGLALMIDVLAGGLSGAGCCREEQVPARDGVLLIAIDVQQFSDEALFHQQVGELVTYVKSCPPSAGSAGVFVPGELEYREAQRRRQFGVPLDENIWNELRKTSARLKVDFDLDPAKNGSPHKMRVEAASIGRGHMPVP